MASGSDVVPDGVIEMANEGDGDEAPLRPLVPSAPACMLGLARLLLLEVLLLLMLLLGPAAAAGREADMEAPLLDAPAPSPCASRIRLGWPPSSV